MPPQHHLRRRNPRLKTARPIHPRPTMPLPDPCLPLPRQLPAADLTQAEVAIKPNGSHGNSLRCSRQGDDPSELERLVNP